LERHSAQLSHNDTLNTSDDEHCLLVVLILSQVTSIIMKLQHPATDVYYHMDTALNISERHLL